MKKYVIILAIMSVLFACSKYDDSVNVSKKYNGI